MQKLTIEGEKGSIFLIVILDFFLTRAGFGRPISIPLAYGPIGRGGRKFSPGRTFTVLRHRHRNIVYIWKRICVRDCYLFLSRRLISNLSVTTRTLFTEDKAHVRRDAPSLWHPPCHTVNVTVSQPRQPFMSMKTTMSKKSPTRRSYFNHQFR